MTQDERWLVRYNEVQTFIEKNHKNPSKWYVTIDLNGLRGSVSSSVRKLPAPLPVYTEPPLASVPSLVQREPVPFGASADTCLEYDVFISHASEDKNSVVRPLAEALVARGLKVWYDEFELRIRGTGTSIHAFMCLKNVCK